MAQQLSTTPERSALMKNVRQRGTSPELLVRKILTKFGARYRLNVKLLPGSPDIANKARRKAIFVHGCFWHGHEMCKKATLPKRNRAFWKKKLEDNRQRDARNLSALSNMGFDVAVVWECELVDPRLKHRLSRFWH